MIFPQEKSMKAFETRNSVGRRYLTGIFALAIFGSCTVIAQKKETPKPAAPAKPAAAPHTSAAGASKGPTTSSAAKGPTTSSAAKGPTTSSAGKGPTTTTAG